MARTKKMADNNTTEEVVDDNKPKTLYEEYMEGASLEENSATITADGFVVSPEESSINNENKWTEVPPEDLSSHTIDSNTDDKLTTAIKEFIKMDDFINPFGYLVNHPKWKCAINCGGRFAKQ